MTSNEVTLSATPTTTNDNTNTFTNFAEAISEKTGIDLESATKVVGWLITEGVLDAPVVHEEFGEQEPIGSIEQSVGA